MINYNLLREVLRLKDEAIMFPRTKKPNILSVQSVEIPTNRPINHMEWWLYITNNSRQPKYIKPEIVDIQPYKSNLTNAQKSLLKSLSYKPRKKDVSFSVAA